MKNPKLRLRKNARITGYKKLKNEITETVDDCLRDIRWYIVDDVMRLLKKKGIVYAKTSKKDKTKSKRK